MAKKVKHNKIKNTGILFELLTRRLTSDIITGIEDSIAQKLIERYFKNTAELGKEYVLYQALIKQRFADKDKAEDFLTEVVGAHKKLRWNEIKKSKYSLIKEIKDNFDVDDFFKPKLENYKLLASIYKTFQSKSLNETISPTDIVNSKFTIIENILGQTPIDTMNEEDELISEYAKQDEDIRLLTYKILVEKFNDKYSVLIGEQKQLIKEYINNISSVNSLKTYVQGELPMIQKQLTEKVGKVNDKVMKIKIGEVVNQLELMKELKDYDDNHVMAVLNSYELIKELDEVNKDGDN
jgi:hypothetical protein